MSVDYEQKPATIKQVRDMLADRPTRWEMRALLALAVVANQLIPALNLAHSPTSYLGALVERVLS